MAESSPSDPEKEKDGRPVAEFLDEDGNFQNLEGYSGAIDLAGFSMDLGAEGAPVFRMDSTDPNDKWTLQSAAPGVDGEVHTIAVSGDNMYVGGDFINAGGISAYNIARYEMNSRTWHTLGDGLNGKVNAIVLSDGNLYVGGNFNRIYGRAFGHIFFIARYDISDPNNLDDNANWHEMGDGLNSQVHSIVVNGDNLYVGGQFTTADGESANRVARYNMSEAEWSGLGSGLNNEALALAVSGDNLFVGGWFTNAGGESANRVARYDIINGIWHGLGDGVGSNNVRALAISEGNLYVGGDFTSAGGISGRNRIARYNINDESWYGLGDGINQSFRMVQDLAVSGGSLYVAGRFTNVGESTERINIARYDISNSANLDNNDNWYSLGDGVGSGVGTPVDLVYALEVSENNLYVGGRFTTVSGLNASNVVRYDISNSINLDDNDNWETIGNGVGNTVRALAVSENNLFVGGDFISVGAVRASRIARYDMNEGTWHRLGDGLDGTNTPLVQALAVHEGSLYVGGFFTSAGGVSARNIARYNISNSTNLDDNTNWQGIGSEVGSFPVYAIVVHGESLYVGGEFRWTGEPRYIARYHVNTGTWHELGAGMNNTVYALVVDGDNLYAGGLFTSADGVPANRVARYDISTGTWHGLGGGVSHPVNALAVIGTNLYVGGDFSSAGGKSASRIARYDISDSANLDSNTNWFSLGSGVNNSVRALSVSGENLYVGGDFTTAGGESNRGRITYFDTNDGTWHGLGDGLTTSGSDKVFALAVSDVYLFVGGDFINAGGKPASRFARWSGLAPKPETVVLSAPNDGDNQIAQLPELSWDSATNAMNYDLQVSSELNFSVVTYNQSGLTSTSHTLSSALDRETTYYWRVRGDNSGTKGDWSATQSFTTIPNVPVQVSLNTPSDGATDSELRPDFSWTAATGAITYELQVSIQVDLSNPVINQSGLNSTQFQPGNDFSENTTYYWRVRGVNVGGNGPWSSIQSFTTLVNVPSQVALSTPDDGATNTIVQPDLSWNSATNASSYDLQVSGDSEFSTVAYSKSGLTATTHTIENALSHSTIYYWRVRGDNNGTKGAWSSTRSFTTLSNTPNQVTLSSPADGNTNTILQPELIWSGVTNASSYDLQVSTQSDLSGTVIDQNVSTSTFTPASILTRATAYYWRVRGDNDGVKGEWSATRSFTTIPNVPAQVALSGLSEGSTNTTLQPPLSWAAAEGADSYELQIAGDVGFNTLVYTQSGLGISHTPTSALNRATTYHWRVRGVNPGGQGPWSGVRSFTTIPEVPAQVVLSSPGEGQELEEEDLSPEFSWQEVSGAGHYLLELSTGADANFAGGLLYSSDPISETDFTLPESVELEYSTTYFWRVWAVNAGGNGPTGEIRGFTTGSVAPPQSMQLTIGPDGQIQISWDGSGSSPRIQFFDIFCGPAPWNLEFCERVDADQFSMNSQGSAVAKGANLTSLESEYFAVQAVINENLKSALSDVVNIVDITGQIPDQWSLISLPVDDAGVEVESSALFSFSSNNYVRESVLAPGRAYWARSDEQESYTRRAPGLTRTSLELVSGWNMLGGLVAEVAVADIADPDSVLGVTPVYSWSGDDYVPADTLAPFEGYWIFADEPGTIELRLQAEMAGQDNSEATMIAASSLSNNEPEGVNTDQSQSPQKLVISTAAQSRSLQLYPQGLPGEPGYWLLPPQGPAERMDLRTGEGLSAVGSSSQSLELSGGQWPMTVMVTGQGDPDYGWVLSGRSGQDRVQVNLLPEMAVQLTEPLTELHIDQVHRDEMIFETQLMSGYPNPFNPSVNLRYRLAQAEDVTMQIYDIAGRRVATLVNARQQPGSYTVQFNGASLASGIYFVRLRSGSTLAVQKISLIK